MLNIRLIVKNAFSVCGINSELVCLVTPSGGRRRKLAEARNRRLGFTRSLNLTEFMS